MDSGEKSAGQTNFSLLIFERSELTSLRSFGQISPFSLVYSTAQSIKILCCPHRKGDL